MELLHTIISGRCCRPNVACCSVCGYEAPTPWLMIGNWLTKSKALSGFYDVTKPHVIEDTFLLEGEK
ncbi:hypothetical protein [Methylobacterium nodulans]|uniref:Uncharacterized protein n=1 Tax=Methylobacterium nodulans (strain LMG 21967 / CNCM I-2342 / ORS 2060) TaxID=460265 RepID=B8ITD9_METNO|nr:hypothetical protein [Methylobacterium nodulans]ACL57025.1 hypothetical protein Mnod_2039 [Methylobacterium nodulans ORS 2060]